MMPLDPKSFRQVMAQYATGVAVVAIDVDGQMRGMTVNSFTSVSLEPMLVLFCLDKNAHLAEWLDEMTGYSVNILREEQQALSPYFAGMWTAPEPPSFRFVPWEGGPRLEGCAAALGCVLEQKMEAGDHWVLLARVVALHLGEEPRQPLVYFGSQYRRLAPPEANPAPDGRATVSGSAERVE